MTRLRNTIHVALGFWIAAVSCRDGLEPLPLPPGAFAFTPDTIFRAWWQQMEMCARHNAPFDAVRWYLVPGDEPFRVPTHDDPVVGYWDAVANRIVLLETLPERRAPYIRHEALHAILGRTDHPPQYFVLLCGEVINGPESPYLPATAP